MFASLKKLPAVVIVGIVLVLLFPAYSMWNHSMLKARIQNECLDPRKELQDCYYAHYKSVAHTEGSAAAVKELHERRESDDLLKVNCHEVMHEIGRAAYDERGSIADAYAHADFSCWGGYLHGVVEASMRGKKLPDVASTTIRTMCDSVKGDGERSFTHFSCVHGIGHALMFVSDNDLMTVLERCDDLVDIWEIRQCANGAFMQNMFSNYDDHASDFIDKNDLRYPCNIIREDEQGICYQVQSKVIIDGLGGDFQKAFRFCGDLASSTLSAACTSGLGAAVSLYSMYDTKRIAALCSETPSSVLGESCLYGALTDLEGASGSTSLGKTVCSNIPQERQGACLDILLRAHADFPGKAMNE